MFLWLEPGWSEAVRLLNTTVLECFIYRLAHAGRKQLGWPQSQSISVRIDGTIQREIGGGGCWSKETSGLYDWLKPGQEYAEVKVTDWAGENEAHGGCFELDRQLALEKTA